MESSGGTVGVGGHEGRMANAVGLLLDRASRMPDDPLFEVPDGASWRPIPATKACEDVERLARGLIAAGIRPGDRVGIMSRTRYEWVVTDFALWSVGAVPVPLYETSSAAQIAWIAKDADVVGLFVEDTAMRERAVEACPDLMAPPWVFETGDLQRLVDAGASVPAGHVHDRRQAVRADDLATIVYTSGTTGRPRGALLTHNNLVVHAGNTLKALWPIIWPGRPRMLLFLPLAHVYARVITLVAANSRLSIGLTSSATNLATDARTFKPTVMVVVPRVLEKVYAAAEAKAGTGLTGRLFAWAKTAAITYSRAQQEGRLTLPIRARRAAGNRLVLDRLRRAMGGALRTVVVGGSAMPTQLSHFFRGAGIDVLEGYGLTETCAQTAVGRPGAAVVGSVGPPIPGCQLRIDENGHVLVAGPHLFIGYQGEPPREGEWWDTGDLGRLDEAGNLYLTGRSKDVLVTASGKNVVPGPLEDAVRAHPLVAECVVVGEGRPFVAALLTIDEEGLAAWCARRGRPPMPTQDAGRDPEVREALWQAVNDANALVSRAESIREFAVLDRALTREGGQLTPSLKVKRAVVLEQFAHEIDALYERAAAQRRASRP